MTTDTKICDELLRAAKELACARESAMESCKEWDALERAILAVSEELPGEHGPRYEFLHDEFVRTATLRGGAKRHDACDAEDLDHIAHAIAERDGKWFVIDEIAQETQRDWVLVFIAIEFLRRTKLIIDEETGNRIHAADGFSPEHAVGLFEEAVAASEGD